MASAGGDFYSGELLPVWERFRIKDKAKWSNATHVDCRIDNLIPVAVRQHAEGLRRMARIRMANPSRPMPPDRPLFL